MTEIYQEKSSDAIFDSPFSGMTNEQVIAREAAAVDAVRALARENKGHFQAIWQWGDGGGGAILELIAKEVFRVTAYEASFSREKPAYKKAVIGNKLRTQVFERDKYRCVHCGTHKGLTCDHVYPESKGGETTSENLQTLCKSCNSKKGVKV